MAVVVEPTVSREKLHQLLAEGHEQPSLDYKCTADLNDRQAVVEFAKDVAAMQSQPDGGYLVIGADDHGNVVPDVTPEHAKLFDEATVRKKLAKYLAEPFDIRIALHVVDDQTVALVYVGPNEHGWAIFRENGVYVDRQSKDKFVFRVGEVFVRHGSSSERWMPADQPRLIDQIVARRKETWSAEIRQLLAGVAQSTATTAELQKLPVTALTWRMDAEGFGEAVTEFIRRDDDIPVREVLAQATRDASDLLGHDEAELRHLLDRVTIVAALAIRYERAEWLDRALAALVRIYELGIDEYGEARDGQAAVWLWLDVVTRVYGLGGLAVRLKAWSAVRQLADRQPNGRSVTRYGGWLRHALTMASRAHIFETVETAGLLARAHNVVRHLTALHPDVPAEDEAVLDSLCQFDLLGALVVIGKQGKVAGAYFYPSFARYYSRRTQPAFVLIVTDPVVRRVLFDGDDTLLADAIAEIGRVAFTQSLQMHGAWDGFEDDRVNRFVEEYRSQTGS
ncbi:ATP-binding protein [Actinosynnema sp. NPDC051121]